MQHLWISTLLAVGLGLASITSPAPAAAAELSLDQLARKQHLPAGALNQDAAHWFTDHDPESFSQLKKVQQSIDPTDPDIDLLAAAVFHETNKRRRQHDLPLLKFELRARAAAALQSQAMAEGRFLSHSNPNQPELRTTKDRAEYVGLNPKFIAENVANSFARNYEAGEPFYTRVEEGETIYSYKPGGDPIPLHSPLSFSKALLDQWMDSPGHRKNILHQAPRFLGCSVRPGVQEPQMEKFYSTQVFYTPLPDNQPVAQEGTVILAP